MHTIILIFISVPFELTPYTYFKRIMRGKLVWKDLQLWLLKEFIIMTADKYFLEVCMYVLCKKFEKKLIFGSSTSKGGQLFN